MGVISGEALRIRALKAIASNGQQQDFGPGRVNVATHLLGGCDIDPARSGEVEDISWDYQDSLMDHPTHYQGLGTYVSCRCGTVTNVPMRLEIGFFGILKLLAGE